MKSLFCLALLLAPIIATAAPFKCTDGYGSVIYTNLGCPQGYAATAIANNLSIVDDTVAKALVAQELARSAPPLFNFSPDDSMSESPATSDLARLQKAQSLIQGSFVQYRQLLLGIALITVICFISLLLLRRRKRRKD